MLPPIATARLRLRPLRLADAEAFRGMTDEPGVIAAVHFLRAPFTLSDARRLIEGEGDGRDCFWGVWLREDETLVGTVGAHLRGADELEIGYWFSSSVHGRGVGGEAVASLVEALRTAYPERRLLAECRPENRASWRLLEKIGFRADGTDGSRAGRKRLTLVHAT
jgi:RimJ/RimL family protein N-acetyltransferase